MLLFSSSDHVGLLAQLVERGADNAKAVSSSLTQTMFFLNHYHYWTAHVATPKVYAMYQIILTTYIRIYMQFGKA